MSRVTTALLVGMLMILPTGFAAADQPDAGAGTQGCNCGREESAEDSSRGTCVCLLYEYAIYYPPPPSDPIYYYYGMFCRPNVGGTCSYTDVIRRRTGSSQCRVENGQVICPPDPPSTSNCFWDVYKAVASTTEKPNPPEKPIPMPHSRLARVGAKKILPDEDVVRLITYPGYPGKFTATHFFDLNAGDKTIPVKLQLLELKVWPIPDGPSVEEVKIGLGRQCLKRPPDAAPIDAGKVTPIPPEIDTDKETKLVRVEYDGITYTVLLEDPFPLEPTPAEK